MLRELPFYNELNLAKKNQKHLKDMQKVIALK